MRWIAIFSNRPDTEKLFEENLQAHLDYFASCPQISLAGSITPKGERHSTGGVWIIKGLEYDEALALIKRDPFFLAGMREKIDLYSYRVAPQFEDLV